MIQKMIEPKVAEDIESQPVDAPDTLDDYWATLEEVMESKFQSDYENSTRDDFTDLKKDLENIIKEKLATSMKSLKNDLKELHKLQQK